MPRALSVDLRDRVARYVLSGYSRRQAAKVFGISVSSAIRYVALYLAMGETTPFKAGGNRRGKLKAHHSYLLRRVEEIPDITLRELSEELLEQGVDIHLSNISRFLRSQGLRFKKNAGRVGTKTS